MRSSRMLLAAAIATSLLLTSLAPAGAQTDRRLSVTGSPVPAGGTIRVEGGGCEGASAVAAMMTADGEGHLALPTPAEPDGAGAWAVELTVDPQARPGLYSVVARCLGSYGGYEGDVPGVPGSYDGYDGYGGGGGFEYPPVDVEVLPPPALPDSDGSLTVAPDVVARGEAVRVNGGGWHADEQVTVMLYSTPRVLARVVTDAGGAIDVSVTVPADTTLGVHTVVAMNASSATTPGLTSSAPITVIERGADPADPPPTGPRPKGPPPGDPPTAQPIAQPTGQQPPTAVAGTSQDPGGGTLPFTGGNPWPYVALGLLLLVGGGELYRRSRSVASAD